MWPAHVSRGIALAHPAAAEKFPEKHLDTKARTGNPIPNEISRYQTENAFSYARAGAATVLEQRNLAPHLLISEIRRIMEDATLQKRMGEAGKVFARPDAAQKIAKIIIETALEHQSV